MKNNHVDRRVHWRFLAILPMETILTCSYGQTGMDLKGMASNIGYGGFCLKTPEPLGDVSNVQARIVLPAAYGTMVSQAKLIWRNDVRKAYGLAFQKIAREELEKLDQYLNRTSDSVKIIADRRCSSRS